MALSSVVSMDKARNGIASLLVVCRWQPVCLASWLAKTAEKCAVTSSVNTSSDKLVGQGDWKVG